VRISHKVMFFSFPNGLIVLVNMYVPIIALFIFELLLELISPTLKCSL